MPSPALSWPGLGHTALGRAPAMVQSRVARRAEDRSRRSPLRAGVVLVYHAVGDPPGDPRRELVPNHGISLFRRQLELIRDRYRPVLASDLLEASMSRRAGEPFPIAVTFDDDLPSHRRVALRALEEMGVPATFFLCGASLAAPHCFWWERLQRVVDLGRLDEVELGIPVSDDRRTAIRRRSRDDIHRVAASIEELPSREQADIAERLRRAAGPDPATAGMRAADVHALAQAGCEVGFHTLRHPALDMLGDAELDAALVEGRDALEDAAGHALRTVSYPHGRANETVGQRARAAGYRSGFTGAPRAVGDTDDPMLIGRITPSFRSAEMLALQIAHALELVGERR